MTRLELIEIVHSDMLLQLEGLDQCLETGGNAEWRELFEGLYDQLVICTELWYQGEKTAL